MTEYKYIGKPAQRVDALDQLAGLIVRPLPFAAVLVGGGQQQVFVVSHHQGGAVGVLDGGLIAGFVVGKKRGTPEFVGLGSDLTKIAVLGQLLVAERVNGFENESVVVPVVGRLVAEGVFHYGPFLRFLVG